MKQEKSKLDELLYKLLLIKTQEGEKLVLIYHRNIVIDESINEKGKVSKKTKQIIDALDITETLDLGQTVLETIEVTNISQFKETIKIVSAKNYVTEMMALVTLILSEIQTINQTNLELGSIIAVVKLLLQPRDEELEVGEPEEVEKPEDHEGNLILGGTTEPLAHIVFKAITGNGKQLEKMMTRPDIERIGSVLKEIILNHIHSDLEDVEKIKRLKAEIEFKIVDALPHDIKAGDINLNMDAIMEEIKRFQGGEYPQEGHE
jgi:hypothetical protein